MVLFDDREVFTFRHAADGSSLAVRRPANIPTTAPWPLSHTRYERTLTSRGCFYA
jgi:hypothetical protein